MVEIHVQDTAGETFALGSGFFVDEYGTIVTNYHVIEGGYSASAMFNEVSYEITEILAFDAATDLAILRCTCVPSTPLPLSTRGVAVGETVYTLGSSVGLTGTFADGIVSSASRVIDGVDYIQTNAPISPGNSGGPLLNSYGEVVGINTMMFTDGQNLNFAINIQAAAGMLDYLSSYEATTLSALYEEYYSTPSTTASYPEDEGTWVFDDADYAEAESNDFPSVADLLLNGYWVAGYCDGADYDWYGFELEQSVTISLYLYSYYKEDASYLLCGIFDSDASNLLDVLSIAEDLPYVGQKLTITLPAGVYYVVVALDDVEYPYDTGAFYELLLEY